MDRKSLGRSVWVTFTAFTIGACSLAAGGCGRHVHTNAPAGESPRARPQASDFVEIAWQDERFIPHSAANGWVSSDGVHYVSELPISIPARIPETLEFKVDIPKSLASLSLAFQADLLGKDGVPSGVSVQDSLREPGVFRFQLRQVGGALEEASDGKAGEKRFVLRILGTDPDSGMTMFDGKMDLVTPPSRIDVVQESVDSFEKRSGALPLSRKSISTEDETLHLLQVLTFHNPSDLPMDITLPSKPSGSLLVQFQDVTVDARLCSFSIHSSLRTQSLSSNLRVIPFNPPSQAEGDDSTIRVSVPPQGSEFAGIYSAGDEAQQVTERDYPRPMFEETDVTDTCNARCASDQGSPTYVGFYARAYWSRQGWPGASAICAQKLADPCAEWELSSGAVPWDERRFCRSPKRGGPEPWILNPHHTKVKTGTQGLQITVDIDPEQLNGSLSFSGTNSRGDPESRDFPVFSKVSVQRII